jgi:Protein of unknown function (DUF3034)
VKQLKCMPTAAKSISIACLAMVVMCCGAWAETGKLLLTGGVSSVDGSAGGGISPWALTGTYATEGQWGVSAHLTSLKTQDYGLLAYGVAVSYDNRFEVTLSQQSFDASPATALNGLGFNVAEGQRIALNTVGLKARVFGDAVLDADTWKPQVSVGLLYKENQAGTIRPVLEFLDASTYGVEAYVAASKLLLNHNVLLNATLRYTKANQGGLLGFGSAAPGKKSASWQPEISVAYLISKHLAIGFEYRAMPNNLDRLGVAAGLGNGLAASDWKDIFIAWAPNKNFSMTAAYADLGKVLPAVTNNRNQSGMYLSLQITH